MITDLNENYLSDLAGKAKNGAFQKYDELRAELNRKSRNDVNSDVARQDAAIGL